MAVLTFDLIDGFAFGDKTYFTVGLRELTTPDLIDAQLKAEKVVAIDGKAFSYTSDVLYGLEMLGRQIESIGDIQGPFELKDLRKLSQQDFDLVQKKATELDQMIAEELAKALQLRGRTEDASGD